MKPRNKRLQWLQKRLNEGDARLYQRTIKRMIKEIGNRNKARRRIEVAHFASAGMRYLLN